MRPPHFPFRLGHTLPFGQPSPPAGEARIIYFQDGFESGVFVPPWDYVWDQHAGAGVTFSTAYHHTGAKSAQCWYNKAPNTGDDDEACFYGDGGGSPHPMNLTHAFIRGYVHHKSPESGGVKDGIQRKLFYGRDSLYRYQMFLTSECAGGLITPRLASSVQSISSSITINFDTWYCMECEVLLNTPDVADGAARLWIDGTLRAESTAFEWRTTDYGAPGNLDYVAVGYAADNSGGGGQINEYRYWDDIVISNLYIGV